MKHVIVTQEFGSIYPRYARDDYKPGEDPNLSAAEVMSPVELAQFLNEVRHKRDTTSKLFSNLSRLACTQAYAAAALEDINEAATFAAITEIADVDRYWQLREEQPLRRDGFDSRMPEPWAEKIFGQLLSEATTKI